MTAAGFDFTCLSNQPLLRPTDNANKIGGFKGGDDTAAVVDFTRALNTGNSNGVQLPAHSHKKDHPVHGPAVKELIMEKDGDVERIGVFNCEGTKDSFTHNIPTIILHDDGESAFVFFFFSNHLYFDEKILTTDNGVKQECLAFVCESSTFLQFNLLLTLVYLNHFL